MSSTTHYRYKVTEQVTTQVETKRKTPENHQIKNVSTRRLETKEGQYIT